VSLIAKFCSDERGATSIEYGLIAAVVGLGLVVALSDIQAALNGILGSNAGAISSAME
jgi:pilus assembly protein Flp/PilA